MCVEWVKKGVIHIWRSAQDMAQKTLKPARKTPAGRKSACRGKKAGEKKRLASESALQNQKQAFAEKIKRILATKPKKADDVFEVFSRPRLAPVAHEMGLKAQCSLDIVCGWDALDTQQSKQGLALQGHLSPRFLMASPPCTMYSALMRLWNLKRMKRAVRLTRQKDADQMVDQAVQHCELQLNRGNLFCFEHPATASSWKGHAKLSKKMHLPGTYTVLFDQCCVGLRSPAGQPIKKRTRLWTNSMGIVNRFKKFQCRCTVPHRRIMGSEKGHKLSTWSQAYPRKMVENLLKGAVEDF